MSSVATTFGSIFWVWKLAEKINKFKQIVLDTINKLRSKTKDQMRKPYLKIPKKNAAINRRFKHVEGNIDLLIASRKLENGPTAEGLDSVFILKKIDIICNVTDDNREVSNDTFISGLVHGNPIPFSLKSPEFSNDINRHFQQDFVNDFNSAVETAQTKLMGIISEL